MRQQTIDTIWLRLWGQLKFVKGQERAFEISYKDVFMYSCKQFLNKLPSDKLTSEEKLVIKTMDKDSLDYKKLDALYNKNLGTTFDLGGFDDLEEEVHELDEKLKHLPKRVYQPKEEFSFRKVETSYITQ